MKSFNYLLASMVSFILSIGVLIYSIIVFNTVVFFIFLTFITLAIYFYFKEKKVERKNKMRERVLAKVAKENEDRDKRRELCLKEKSF